MRPRQREDLEKDDIDRIVFNTVPLGETQPSVNKHLETKVQRLELYKD